MWLEHVVFVLLPSALTSLLLIPLLSPMTLPLCLPPHVTCIPLPSLSPSFLWKLRPFPSEPLSTKWKDFVAPSLLGAEERQNHKYCGSSRWNVGQVKGCLWSRYPKNLKRLWVYTETRIRSQMRMSDKAEGAGNLFPVCWVSADKEKTGISNCFNLIIFVPWALPFIYVPY